LKETRILFPEYESIPETTLFVMHAR